MRGGRTQHVLGTDETGGWIRGQVLSKANLCFLSFLADARPAVCWCVSTRGSVACVLYHRRKERLGSRGLFGQAQETGGRHRRQVAGIGDRWQA